ncbi:uncharacterized protein EV422DRAFT_362442 [Fimicolochytrium jonesii]|uniref:uncharacterized protein n=1 Tax=Fimicolochytrium jonesii TaxID=1396493 RepID=UPI0022FE9F8E|nr:uncharacterized protein EV422DRAFT_362442 [Fimicolochytrium jonesii]KAI8823621.1 hypothetical protein EV422DRAFT_362442 [Fimicolochytrium jonesii]
MSTETYHPVASAPHSAAPHSAHVDEPLLEHTASVPTAADGYDGQYDAVSAYAHAHNIPEDQVRQDLAADDLDENDPENVLHRTADDNYSLSAPKATFAGRVASWYKPVYDYKTPNLTDKQRRAPRYCGGRYRRWQFIVIHVLLFWAIFLIIMIPVGYFVVIPKMVQHELNKQKLSDVKLERLSIGSYSAQQLGFSVKAQLPAPHWLPITVEIGETDVQLNKRGDEKTKLLNLHIPGLKATLNKGLVIDMDGNVGTLDANMAATSKLVQQLSSPEGINNVELQARGKFPIKMFGITWYKGLELYLNLGMIDHFDSKLLTILKGAPTFLKNPDVNKKMALSFKQEDMISILTDIGFPQINIQALDVVMNDAGITIATTIFMENPTKLALAKVQGLTFGLELEDQLMAKAKVHELALVPNEINKLDLVVELSFDDPAISKDKVSKTISAVLWKLLAVGDTDSLKVAIAGPIGLGAAEWVGGITGPLKLYLPMKEILDGLKFGEIRKLLTLEGVSQIAAGTKISANVLSDSINVPATMALPRLVPLPKKININYNISASLYGGDQRALGLNLWPLSIETSSKDMKISTTVVLTPENSQAAAVALAAAINPLLAAQPKPSTLNLKDLAFFAAPAAGQAPKPFGWSDTLFKDSTIGVPLPPIVCIPCLLDMLTKNGTEIPFGIVSLAIEQLLNAPGFSAIGAANVNFPDTLPQITADLGYASLDLAVEQVPAASAVLPQGLKFFPGTGPVPLNAQAILSRDPALPGKVQNLVNSLFHEGAGPSSVGITNLIFGPSANTSFVTFSKINIELNTTSFAGLIDRLTATAKSTLLKPGMIHATALDLEVVSATEVNVGIGADFVNPVNITVSVGNIDLDALIDDARLLSLALPPLKLALGPGGLNIKAGLQLATGADGMAQKIATLVNDVVSGGQISNLFGITNLVLSPPGTRGTANPAIIDQIKTVKITMPPSVINEMLANPADSPLDLSNILPSADLIDKLAIGPQAATLETLPGGVIAVSGSVGYNNPLAISAKIPFVQLEITLGGHDFVVAQISDIVLSRGQAVMTFKVVLIFNQNDPELPEIVAQFVNNFLAGHIDPAPGVKGVLFGGSPQSVNDLLSAVDVNLAPITDTIDTNALIDRAMSMLPFKFPMHPSELVNSALGAVEGVIDIQTLPQKTLGVKMNVGLKLPFALTVNIGYFEVALGINSHPLLRLILNSGVHITGGGVSQMNVDALIPFEDDEDAQRSVGNLVANFFQGSSLDTVLNIGNIRIGASANDIINAFTKVQLNLNSDALIALDGPSDIFSLMGNMHPDIGGLTIETRPGNNLGLIVAMGINLPLRITAHVGYLGAHLSLNSFPMLDFLLPQGIEIQAPNGVTQLNLNTQLQFVDTEQTQIAVNELLNRLVRGQHLATVLGIGRLAIGANAGDLITALSKVELPADLERGMAVMGMPVPFSIGGTIRGLDTNIKSVKMYTAAGHSLLVNAAADFKLPLPVSLRLGYAALSANVDNNPLADATVGGGISITRDAAGRGNLVVPQDINLLFTDNRATQEAIRDLVDAVLFTGDVKSSAGVKNVHLGNSAAEGDRLTIVNKIDVTLAVREVLEAAGMHIPLSLPQLGGMMSNMGTITARTMPAKTLAIEAGADLSFFGLPLDVNIGHVAAKANLDGQVNTARPVCDVQVPSRIIVNAGNKLVDVKANIIFTDNENTQEEVNKLVQQALGSDHLDAIIGANGLELGESATDLITAFSLVNIRLAAQKLVTDMGVHLPIEFTQVAGNMDLAVKSAGIRTDVGQVLHANATAEFNLALPISIVFQTGYFHAAALLQDQQLTEINLPQGIALSTIGEKRKSLSLALDMKLTEDPAMQDIVATLVDNVLNSPHFGMNVGAGNILFGSDASEANVITILRRVHASLSMDALLGGMIHLPLDLGTAVPAALGGGIITVATLPGKRILATANVGIQTPFPLSIDVGFFGAEVDVSASKTGDLNPLMSVVVPAAIHLSLPGTARLGVMLGFIDTEATQNAIAALVQRAFTANSLDGRIALNHIAFGPSPTDVYKVLQKINAKLSLDDVMRMAGLKVPLQMSDVAGMLKLSQFGGDLKTLPGGALDLSATAKAVMPFQVAATVGYFGTSVDLDTVRFLDTHLGLAILPGAGDASAGFGNTAAVNNCTIQFNQIQDIGTLKSNVNSLVNWVLSGTGDKPKLHVRNVQVGYSPSDLITAFDKIDLALDLGIFLPGMGITVPIDLTKMDLLNGITLAGNMGVELLPGKLIAVNGTAGVKLPSGLQNIRLQAGWVGADAGVDEAPLAQVGMPLLIAPSADGAISLNLNTNVKINEDVATTPAAVGKVVSNYFNMQKQVSSARLSQIRFGASQTDVIEAFTGIVAHLPLAAVIDSTKPPIDLGLLLASALKGADVSSLKILKVILELLPADTIHTAIGAAIPGLHLPIALSAKLPYVSASAIAMDKVPVASAEMNNVNLANPFGIDFDALIQIKDSDSLKKMLAEYMYTYLKEKKFPGTLELGGLAAGASKGPADLIMALSQSVFPIRMDPLVQALTGLMNGGGGPTGITVTTTPTGGVAVQIDNALIGKAVLTLNNAAITFQPHQTIDMHLSTGLELAFPLTLNVPYFGASVLVDNKLPVADMVVKGLKTTGSTNGTNVNLDLDVSVNVHDSPQLAGAIAALFDAIINHHTIPGAITVSNVLMGVSADDRIEALSALVFSFPFNGLLGTIGGITGSLNLDLVAIVKGLGLTVSKLLVRTDPGRAVHVGLAVAFKSNLPITITGLNYVSLSIAIDKTDLITSTLSGLNIAPGSNNLAIEMDNVFPTGAKDVVAKFFKDLKENPTGMTQIVGASKITFGLSKDDAIKMFSMAQIGIAAKDIFGKVSGDSTLIPAIFMMFGIDLDKLTPEVLQKMISLRRAIVDLGTASKITVDAAVGVVGLPTIFDIDIGYLNGEMSLDSELLAKWNLVNGIKVTTEGGMITAGVNLSVDVNDSDKIADIIAAIVNDYIAGKAAAEHSVAMANIVFGESATDNIDTLQAATISVSITTILNGLPKFSSLTSLSLPEGFGLDAVDVDVATTSALAISVNGHAPNNGQFGLNLPYGTLSVMLQNQEFMVGSLENFALRDGHLGGALGAEFRKNAYLIAGLGMLTGDLLFHRDVHFPLTSAGAKDILFGSKEKPFRLLSKINLEVPQATIASTIADIKTFMDAHPIVLDDIRAFLNARGIGANVKIPAMEALKSLPVNLKFQELVAQVQYKPGGTGRNYHATDVVIQPPKIGYPEIVIDLEIVPDLDEANGIIEPLYEALTYMFTWNSFSQHAMLGWLLIKGSNGVVFDIFDKLGFYAGNLYFWEPLDINIPVLVSPIQHLGLAPLPFGAELSFPNPYGFGLLIGEVDIRLHSGDTDLLRIATNGNCEILNVHQGGTQKGTRNFILSILFPMDWKDILKNIFNPIGAIKEFFDHLRALFDFKNYRIGLNINDPNTKQDLAWFATATGVLFTKRFAENSLGPILGAVLTKVVIHAFGALIKLPFINIEKLPFVGPLVQQANAILSQAPSRLKFSGALGERVGAGYESAAPLAPGLLGLPDLDLPPNFAAIFYGNGTLPITSSATASATSTAVAATSAPPPATATPPPTPAPTPAPTHAPAPSPAAPTPKPEPTKAPVPAPSPSAPAPKAATTPAAAAPRVRRWVKARSPKA